MAGGGWGLLGVARDLGGRLFGAVPQIIPLPKLFEGHSIATGVLVRIFFDLGIVIHFV